MLFNIFRYYLKDNFPFTLMLNTLKLLKAVLNFYNNNILMVEQSHSRKSHYHIMPVAGVNY